SPASIAVTVLPASTPEVFTAVGTVWGVSLPLPILPREPLPQQYAAPSAIAQAWSLPALMAVIVFPLSAPVASTAIGARVLFSMPTAPLPSCPMPPLPQQYATPSAMAQVNTTPELMALICALCAVADVVRSSRNSSPAAPVATDGVIALDGAAPMLRRTM